jgi:hypothetical protein
VRAHLLFDFASLDQFVGDKPNLGALRIVVDVQFVPYQLPQQGFARNSSRPDERKAAGIRLSRDLVGEAKRGESTVAAFGGRFKRGGFDSCLRLGPSARFIDFALFSPPPQGKDGRDSASKNECSGEDRDARRVHVPSIAVRLTLGNGAMLTTRVTRRSPERSGCLRAV